MRLIDANELPKLFDAEFKQTSKLIRSGEKHLDNLAEGFAEAIRIAKYIAPTVDAVPVVRCRECTKRGTNNCPMEQDYPWISSDSNGFCSYGERREADYDGKEN